MLHSQVQILQYQEQFQNEIDTLIENISKEFLEPISVKNTNRVILPPDLYLLAVLENKMVGTISITRLENGNSVLRKMFLNKNYRGQGIAEQLLQSIQMWALENNVKAIYLGTMTQFITAQKFYKRHHFEEIDKTLLPSDFPINPLDSIFYKLNLAQSL